MVYKLFKDGELVNTIVASPAFVDAYAMAMGYTYELVPETKPEPEVEPTPEPTPGDNSELEARVAALESAIEEGLTLYEEDLGDE